MKTTSASTTGMRSASFWRTFPGICAIALIAATVFYLATKHTAHFFGAWPYLFLLACPIMHLFMHHGHGGHHSHIENKPEGDK